MAVSPLPLASNENPLGMPAAARAAAAEALAAGGLYPDPGGPALRRELAERLGVTPAHIVLGSGSSEILTLAAQALVAPGQGVIWSQYGFVVYGQAAALARGRPVVVPARGYGHDLGSMAAAVDADTRLLFVANPNNPTGSFIDGARLREFIESVPAHATVLLDEAYAEYLAPGQRYDSMAWVRRFPNLLVARTFSKAYGLAGLRIGYGVGAPALVARLDAIRPRFNITTPALAAARAALGDADFLRRTCAINTEGRARLADGLATLGVEVLPSAGNFVMARFADASAMHAALGAAGIAVAVLGAYQLPDWLRITVGLPRHNDAVLAAVAAALAS